MDNINKMLTVLSVLIMCFVVGGLAEQCGSFSDGDVSAPAPPSGGLGRIISKATFNKMLKHRNDNICPAKGFYTYEAFIQAAKSFPAFGNTGNVNMRKREVAAFLGQTSHETSGGSPTAPDGPYAWGYCFNREIKRSTYCQPSSQYPCAPGKQYYGRGPIQLTWNYNYGRCGKDIKADLLKNPDLVATNRLISFKTALWFWMTTQKPKPSCHDVITGKWKPSAADKAARRLPGVRNHHQHYQWRGVWERSGQKGCRSHWILQEVLPHVGCKLWLQHRLLFPEAIRCMNVCITLSQRVRGMSLGDHFPSSDEPIRKKIRKGSPSVLQCPSLNNKII